MCKLFLKQRWQVHMFRMNNSQSWKAIKLVLNSAEKCTCLSSYPVEWKFTYLLPRSWKNICFYSGSPSSMKIPQSFAKKRRKYRNKDLYLARVIFNIMGQNWSWRMHKRWNRCNGIPASYPGHHLHWNRRRRASCCQHIGSWSNRGIIPGQVLVALPMNNNHRRISTQLQRGVCWWCQAVYHWLRHNSSQGLWNTFLSLESRAKDQPDQFSHLL